MAHEFVPVTFSGGLVTEWDESTLPPGSCTELENYEPTPNGGLRIRRGWMRGPADGAPAIRRVRGISSQFVTSDVRQLVFGADNDAGDMVLFQKPYLPLDADTWTLIDIVSATDYRFLPIAYATGGGVLLHAHIGYNDAKLRTWDGTSAATATDDPIAGRALAYHLSRFWSGGELANPTFLRFSELGNPNNWNVTENFIPIGEADGDPIESICVFDRGLVVGKESSLWYVSGTSPDSFSATPLHDYWGVAPGRNLVPSSFGVFMVGEEDVCLWNGSTVERVSKVVDYALNGCYSTAVFVNDRLYITDGSGDMWCYEHATGRWWRETYESRQNGFGEVIAHHNTLIAGTPDAQVSFPILFRDEFEGARTPDQGVSTRYRVATDRMWLGSTLKKIAPKDLYVRASQRGQNGADPLRLGVVVDGNLVPTKAVVPTVPAVTKVHERGWGTAGASVKLTFEQLVQAEHDCAFDLQEVGLWTLIDGGRR